MNGKDTPLGSTSAGEVLRRTRLDECPQVPASATRALDVDLRALDVDLRVFGVDSCDVHS